MNAGACQYYPTARKCSRWSLPNGEFRIRGTIDKGQTGAYPEVVGRSVLKFEIGPAVTLNSKLGGCSGGPSAGSHSPEYHAAKAHHKLPSNWLCPGPERSPAT